MGQDLRRYRLYIAGRWEGAASGRTFRSINPYTGEPWAEVAEGDAADVDRAVGAAQAAFEAPSWRDLTGGQRGALLRRLGDLIARDADRLARIESTDNGKLIREMGGQLRAIPNWYSYFAGAADKILGEVIPTEKPTIFNYTLREPLGVVGAITPWNSPLLLLTWKLAPALAAGNTVVIKPSEITPASTLELMSLVEEAGFPPGVVNVVPGYGETAGAALCRHPRVAKVAFTGSVETGKLVAKNVAEHLGRVSLELGGKSPQLVFEDADLEGAVNGVVAGVFAATGQTCIAGSRLFLHAAVYDRFVEKLVARAERIRLGDPLDPHTEMGPSAFREQWEKILRYIELGKMEGAKLLCGGEPPADPGLARGFFVRPTVFAEVTNDMRVAQEEIFGPVLCVLRFADEADAIRQANATCYGLAAGVWTQDVRRAHRLARALEAGTVWINTYRAVSSASPFGGYKQSGIGRENGLQALHEYTQVKSVWVELGGPMGDPFVLR